MFDQTCTEREHHTNFWVKTYFVRSEALDRGPPVKSILPRNVSELDLPPPCLPPLSTESHSKLAKLWSPRARLMLVLVIADQNETLV